MNTAKKLETSNVIDISSAVRQGKKSDRLATKIVSGEDFERDRHFADALTDKEDINKIITCLYEDNKIASMVFFVVGINIGYRPVDILAWRWIDIVDENGNIIRKFAMPEHKTSKTAVVNLNDTVTELLSWLLEYKIANNPLFTYDEFVFSSYSKRGTKTYTYYDTEEKVFWHSDKKHKAKGVMFRYSDKGTVVCDENIILSDGNRYIKLLCPQDTDTLSKHLMKAAKESNIAGHFSSYTIRQTFSYWFRVALKTDESLSDVADEFFSTMLLSNYFQHSSLKVTQKHYMRDQEKLFAKVIENMNLGSETVEKIVNSHRALQTALL